MEDVPGTSKAPYITPGKSTENFFRLCQLIMTICSDLLREILSHYIHPTNLRSELDKNRKRLENLMNHKQRSLIYPTTGNAPLVAKDMDISVLYIILRNICNISHHQKGWGNAPLKGDTSIAACIERIRLQRNSIIAHSTNSTVEDVEFKNIWAELRDAIVEIEKQLTGGESHQRHVDSLLTCNLNPTDAEMYKAQFDNMQSQLIVKQENIESIEKELQENIESIEKELQEQISMKRERVENLEKKVEECSERKRKKNTEFTKQREIEDLEKRDKRLEDLEKRVKRLEDEQRRLTSKITESKQVTKKGTMIGDLSSVSLYLKSPALESSIDVPDMLLIHHITGIKSDRLWVGGFSYMKEKILKQVDSSGNVIETINDANSFLGNFAITQKGELLYLEKDCNKVQRKTPNGTTTIITTSKDENIKALFSSQITGDLLVGVHNFPTNAGKLTRYDKTGAKIQDIEVDNDGQTLYSNPVYIAENRNEDIVTADSTKHRVVLVKRSGEYRGYYNGQTPNKREFDPHGVCTDVHGHIMVVDYTSGSIHLLDPGLRFLTFLLKKEEHNLKSASALFVDENHHLYVGSENGRINVYKYLKDV